MNEIKEYTEKLFEDIKHIDENGNQYWLARELMIVLEYKRWDKFCNVIENAKISCKKSNYIIENHFSQVGRMVEIGSKTSRNIIDFKLSRYACYLIVQNSDPRKEVVALGQTYFAIQTRKQELTEKEYSDLTEDEKRFYQRDLTRKGNYSLNIAARNAGVKNFDRFHNSGYKGLYNGETANDIAKRKKLRYREDILDNMGSDELFKPIMNIFMQQYKFNDEALLKNYKSDNKLVWYSDCYYNPDDEWSRNSVSYLTIEYENQAFKLKCTKPLDAMIDRKDKSHVIGFSPLGNGNYARNIKTGLTLQDDFVINVYRKLLKKQKIRELHKKQM